MARLEPYLVIRHTRLPDSPELLDQIVSDFEDPSVWTILSAVPGSDRPVYPPGIPYDGRTRVNADLEFVDALAFDDECVSVFGRLNQPIHFETP